MHCCTASRLQREPGTAGMDTGHSVTWTVECALLSAASGIRLSVAFRRHISSTQAHMIYDGTHRSKLNGGAQPGRCGPPGGTWRVAGCSISSPRTTGHCYSDLALCNTTLEGMKLCVGAGTLQAVFTCRHSASESFLHPKRQGHLGLHL